MIRRCQDIGLSPENISFYLVDLLEPSKTVSLSKIPDYVKEKTNEKRKLEEDTEKLKVQIETVQVQKSDAESLRDIALQGERMTSSELKRYSNLTAEFRKYVIPIDDISKFAKLVKNLKTHFVYEMSHYFGYLTPNRRSL
ncbi:MAG: hypothetical protein WA323_28695 [Candidatus Nitrosopolaris sp.]